MMTRNKQQQQQQNGASSSSSSNAVAAAALSLNSFEFLSNFQKGILSECLARRDRGGTMHVPVGAGKTALSIALCLLNGASKEAPVLVVCPKSLLCGWKVDLRKFYPTLTYHVLHPDSDSQHFTRNVLHAGVHIVFVTPEVAAMHLKKYEASVKSKIVRADDDLHSRDVYMVPDELPLLSDHQEGGPLFTTTFSSLVIDEASKYLNFKRDRTLAMIGIHAHKRWLLTATLLHDPTIEKLFGYHLLINEPNTPRTYPEFKAYVLNKRYYYGRNSSSSNGGGFGPYRGIRNTMVMRHVNEDYIPEDLGITVHQRVVFVPLLPAEAAFFTSIKRIIDEIYHEYMSLGLKNRMYNNGNSSGSSSASSADVIKAMYKEELKTIRGILMSLISYLRISVVCSIIALTSMYLQIANVSNRNYISDAFTKKLIKENAELLRISSSSSSDGTAATAAAPALFSNRIRMVTSLIHDHRGCRVIVYSSFRTVLRALKYCMRTYLPTEEQRRREWYTFDGNESITRRDNVLQQWENSEEGVLGLTYAIGSAGLNLQAGSVVILIDYEWDSSSAKQAVGRCNRRGQTASELFLYHMTSNTGFERSLFNLFEIKLAESEYMISGKQQQQQQQQQQRSSSSSRDGGSRSTMSLKTMMSIINADDNLKLAQKIFCGDGGSSIKKKEKDEEVAAADDAICIEDDDVIYIEDDDTEMMYDPTSFYFCDDDDL